METPKLDALMKNAGHQNVWTYADETLRLNRLFARHGRALVAVLKNLADDSYGPTVDGGDICLICGEHERHGGACLIGAAEQLLAQMEQEAG